MFIDELDLIVLDQRVREQLLAHRLELGGILHVQLHEPADVDVLDAAETERGERALHGDALRVEDARLRADQHACPHAESPVPAAEVAPELSSQAWNGWPVMRSYAST